MAGIGDALWKTYQASPPALLALLTVVITVGGRRAFSELQALHDRIDDVDEKVDRQEMLIDDNARQLERQREARKRNDRRIEQLLQQQAAAHGFDGRPGAEATTGQSRDPTDPSGSDDGGDL